MRLTHFVDEYKYKGMPKNVKEFIIERLGKREAQELFNAIRLSNILQHFREEYKWYYGKIKLQRRD